MERYAGVSRTSLRVLVGVLPRILLALAIDRHGILLDFRLVCTDEGEVIIILAPGKQAYCLQLFLIDPVSDAIHYLVRHPIAGHLNLSVELKFLNEYVPRAYEGDHTTIGAKGGDHHLASGSA